MLELKAIKYAAFNSHETHCYRANLYFNGRKVGQVSNEGYGGPDSVDWVSKKAGLEVLEYANEHLREPDNPEFERLYAESEPYTLIELWCGHAMNEWLDKQELKKLLAKRVLWTKPGEPGIYQTQSTRAHTRNAWIREISRTRVPGQVILNELPFDEALAIFRERTQ